MKNYTSIFMLLMTLFICQEGAAQGKYGATKEDSVKCVQNISLYSEFVKQKNYNDAIGPWRKVIEICPGASENAYINGLRMYKDFIRKEKDKERKSQLIDTLLLIYDWRMENFGDEAYVMGRKGADMLKYKEENAQAASEILKKSIDMRKEQSEAGVLAAYYQSLYELQKNNTIEKEVFIAEYLPVVEYIDYNIKEAASEKKASYYQRAKDNIDQLFTSVADCPSMVNIAKKKYAESPEDPDVLEKSVKMLREKECVEDPIYFEIASKLQSIKPSLEAARVLGGIAIEKGSSSDAKKYFQQAIELNAEKVDLEEDYLNLAIAYLKLRDYGSARNYALKALEIRPKWGKPYVVIADAIALSAKSCGDEAFKQNAVYWLAVDYLNKAKSVDSDYASVANQKIASYQQYFPTKQDAFFYGFKEGDAYEISCWITESTTVRVR